MFMGMVIKPSIWTSARLLFQLPAIYRLVSWSKLSGKSFSLRSLYYVVLSAKPSSKIEQSGGLYSLQFGPEGNYNLNLIAHRHLYFLTGSDSWELHGEPADWEKLGVPFVLEENKSEMLFLDCNVLCKAHTLFNNRDLSSTVLVTTATAAGEYRRISRQQALPRHVQVLNISPALKRESVQALFVNFYENCLKGTPCKVG